jgi:hypothetical protein
MDWKIDSRSPRAAWAPGDYLNRCITCRDRFMGDKRALSCADCAYSPSASKVISEARLALSDYYFALDQRVDEDAVNKLVRRLGKVLDMEYVPGKETKTRENLARFYPQGLGGQNEAA